MNPVYFISSLPMLLEGCETKLSMESFVEAAERSLAPSLVKAIHAMISGADDAHPFVVAWRDKEKQLSNAIAHERAKRLSIQLSSLPLYDAKGCEVSIRQEVSRAFTLKDPLEREKALEHIRWILLDELQGVQPLSENVILAYVEKLKINIRQQKVISLDGAKNFEALTKQ